jgi:hypothetical protein
MAVNVVQSALSSRRFNRWLPWLGALVLAAGVIAFLVAYFGNTANSKETFGNRKPTTLPVQKTVPLARAARVTAGKFILTAVNRQHLDQAWPLVTDNVKGGLTYKQWLTGNIPVTPLGAPIAKAAITKILSSHRTDALVNVVLVPGPNAAGVSDSNFVMGLKKVGSRWLVDYWQNASAPGAIRPG